MSNCIGKMGEFFGHSFREYLIKSEPTVGNLDGYSGSRSAFMEFLDKTTYKEWIVKCKRCGKEPDNANQA